MSLPLKSLPLEVRQHTHKVLERIARNRGITLREIGREIIETYVAKAVHDAKIVLGQDDENDEPADSGVTGRNQTDPAGARRK